MQINGKEIRITNHSLTHLTLLNDTIEYFMLAEAPLFMKGEPYAPTYKKDKKHFQALISSMVAFKRTLMQYFKKQYDNRYGLIKYPLQLHYSEVKVQLKEEPIAGTIFCGWSTKNGKHFYIKDGGETDASHFSHSGSPTPGEFTNHDAEHVIKYNAAAQAAKSAGDAVKDYIYKTDVRAAKTPGEIAETILRGLPEKYQLDVGVQDALHNWGKQAEVISRFTNAASHPVVHATMKMSDDEEMSNDEEDEDYFFDDYWNNENQDLASAIEDHTKKIYDIGVAGLLIASFLQSAHSATDVEAQKYLLANALKMAGDINTTTQNRVAAAIKTALELGEGRTEFDERLKQIFISPYRGRFIAQNEALKTYIEAKDNAANDVGFTKKTWVGPQAIDEICGDTDGETVGIDEQFSNGLDAPLAHYNCRCDVSYS